MGRIIKIHPENPQIRLIEEIVEALKKGALIIYPTDTVYGLGCDITHTRSMEMLAKIKNVKLEKAHFSIICNDLSHLSNYTKPISNTAFRKIKKALPGPFTFILPAANGLPSVFKHKKTIGIRIPAHNIPYEIVKRLGHPIACTSIHDDHELIEYMTDPELIAEKYSKRVNIIIDGGYGSNEASTVIDLTQDDSAVILREGKGKWENIL